jgi:hypothetical protein
MVLATLWLKNWVSSKVSQITFTGAQAGSFLDLVCGHGPKNIALK